MTPPPRYLRPPRPARPRGDEIVEDKVKTGGPNGSDEDLFEELGITAAEFTYTMAAISSTSSLLLALATDTIGAWAAAQVIWIVVITLTLILYGRFRAWKRRRVR